MTEPLHPCTGCGSTKPADHVYKALKCCPDCDHRAATLDAAWAAAEAALPEGAHLWLISDPEDGYSAEAERVHQRQEAGLWVGGFSIEAKGPTPTAALRALVAALAG